MTILGMETYFARECQCLLYIDNPGNSLLDISNKQTHVLYQTYIDHYSFSHNTTETKHTFWVRCDPIAAKILIVAQGI